MDSVCVGGTATLTASGANSYIWSTAQSGTSVVITPTVSTNYLVNGTYYGCSVSANFTQHVDPACFAGIQQISSLDNQVKIYPNPATNGVFIVSIQENMQNANVVVLNSLGQKVFETKMTGQDDLQIALPSCLPGIYYVQISNGVNGTTSVKKVIVN